MKSIVLITFTATLLLLLSNCTVSEDLVMPKDTVPKAYTNAISGDTTNQATLSWNAFFTDTSLQRLIDTALQKNVDMQVALKNIESANQLFKQARLGWLPQLDFNLNASSTVPSKNSLNGSLTNQYLETNHMEDFNANFGLSWEIDIWGKIRNKKKIAHSVYLQTQEARKAIQTAIVTRVASAFYNLLLLDEQLSIAGKNLLLNDSTLQIIRFQQTAGQVTLLAVQQAQAQQLASSLLVSTLEQNTRLQENALNVLMGRFPNKVERGKGGLTAIKLEDSLSLGVPSHLLKHRPDVKMQELALSIQNARIGIAKADFYPSLRITASGGLNAYRATNWFSIPASLFGNLAGGLTQPIFHHRRIQTQYKIAKIEREKAVLRFRQTVLYAVGEVTDALVKVEKLNEQQLFAAKRANILQQATQNSILLFNSGMANYLEVITTQRNVLESELELAALKYDQLNARIDLYRALGGGWK